MNPSSKSAGGSVQGWTQLLPSGWLHAKTYVENRSQTLAPPPSTILKTLGDPPSNPYPLLLKGCSLPVSPQPRWPSTMSSFHEQGDSKVLVTTRHHASPIPGFTLCPLNKEASAARPRTSAQFGSWVASRLPLPLGPQPTPPPSEMRPAHFIPAS